MAPEISFGFYLLKTQYRKLQKCQHVHDCKCVPHYIMKIEGLGLKSNKVEIEYTASRGLGCLEIGLARLAASLTRQMQKLHYSKLMKILSNTFFSPWRKEKGCAMNDRQTER
jgi:hypothetical protein